MEWNTHNLKWFAMGTYWELTLYAKQETSYLISVAEAIQNEVENTEEMLSFYRDTSDLADLNARAYEEPVTVLPVFYELLQRCKNYHTATQGAFDPTIAPLLRCWRFVGDTGSMPTTKEIQQAMLVVGMDNVDLQEGYTVQFARYGVTLEFGAVGKGYAIDRCVALLHEYEIENALIHGGTSTVYGLGAPPDAEAWEVGIRDPHGDENEALFSVGLRNRALSISAPHNKSFELNGKRYGHVLDPQTGMPGAGCLLAVVLCESAEESDALSTALLTRREVGLEQLKAFRPDAEGIILLPQDADGRILMRSTRDG